MQGKAELKQASGELSRSWLPGQKKDTPRQIPPKIQYASPFPTSVFERNKLRAMEEVWIWLAYFIFFLLLLRHVFYFGVGPRGGREGRFGQRAASEVFGSCVFLSEPVRIPHTSRSARAWTPSLTDMCNLSPDPTLPTNRVPKRSRIGICKCTCWTLNFISWKLPVLKSWDANQY